MQCCILMDSHFPDFESPQTCCLCVCANICHALSVLIKGMCDVLINSMCFFPSLLQAHLVPATAMVDCRCPVRLQTQVTGEDAGTDSVGDDFIKEAEI